jgi:hypothetical protein
MPFLSSYSDELNGLTGPILQSGGTTVMRNSGNTADVARDGSSSSKVEMTTPKMEKIKPYLNAESSKTSMRFAISRGEADYGIAK